MGSVETLCHKGNTVLCQAVKKIKSKDYTPHSCILEVSDTGLRMVDRKKPEVSLNVELQKSFPGSKRTQKKEMS